jgi:hypothetical protein
VLLTCVTWLRQGHSILGPAASDVCAVLVHIVRREESLGCDKAAQLIQDIAGHRGRVPCYEAISSRIDPDWEAIEYATERVSKIDTSAAPIVFDSRLGQDQVLCIGRIRVRSWAAGDAHARPCQCA